MLTQLYIKYLANTQVLQCWPNRSSRKLWQACSDPARKPGSLNPRKQFRWGKSSEKA